MAFSYVVKQGDTLYRIARKNGISVRELLSANPQLDDPDLVIPGQVIQIPDRSPRQYVVQPGDTFFYIARRFNIPLAELEAANPGVDPARLSVGQILTLPPGRGMDVVITTSPYGYAEMMEDIGLLKTRYPFLEVQTIGYSVLGKSIPAIKLGGGPKKVQYNGSFHANEWITTLALMKFIEDYAKAYSSGATLRGRSIKPLYEQTTLWIIPMVNPDGVELVQEGVTPRNPFYNQLLAWNEGSFDFSRWKANIRGVDLNDQFPANWEEEKARREREGPGPRDYPGTEPLTEPEAKAVAAFTRNNNFDRVIAFHTQGQEIYYNYRDLEPPESVTIAERFAKVSGYRPVKLTGSDAGFKDWFIQTYRRPGFTIEAGIGVNPLPLSQFPSIYDETSAIMLEGLTV